MLKGALMGKSIQIAGYSGEIVSEKYNPLVKRREVVVKIGHVGGGTPSRGVLRQELAKLFNVNVENVYVRKIETEHGIGVSLVKAHIYDSPERARFFEPEYIIKRNEEGLQSIQQAQGG